MRALGIGPPLASRRQAVAVAFELRERHLALGKSGGGLRDRRLGDLEAPGVLVAFRRQGVERLV